MNQKRSKKMQDMKLLHISVVLVLLLLLILPALPIKYTNTLEIQKRVKSYISHNHMAEEHMASVRREQ